MSKTQARIVVADSNTDEHMASGVQYLNPPRTQTAGKEGTYLMGHERWTRVVHAEVRESVAAISARLMSHRYTFSAGKRKISCHARPCAPPPALATRPHGEALTLTPMSPRRIWGCGRACRRAVLGRASMRRRRISVEDTGPRKSVFA